mgnify:CR=1 FL=1
MKKYTNAEIKKCIENDINKLGVCNAFKKLVSRNIAVMLPQFCNTPKSLTKIMTISNLAVSISVKNYKEVGLLSKLYDVVLYEKYENVVQDEIMQYAVSETVKLM